ncbi:hypothetical protein ILUMI_21979 [Ignelater luminosus]|uniref:Uncharacterized protein n=1 Tax=Ignelater luminosus TaxID=2038154 RepID=A0A8K0CHP0_IGNLU|nr:hypothetical protein ILUMI_21979 [Ignelater luminosus]
MSYISEKQLPFGSIVISRYLPYEVVLTYQTITFEFIVLSSVVVDVFFASGLAQLSIQCKILQKSIRTIIENSIESARQDKLVIDTISDVPWKYLQKEIEEVVTRHKSIIELGGEFEDITNIPALAVFIGMSAGFCFIVYQVFMVSSPFFFI